MKTILITGSNGFVGRHLVKRLLKRGDIVWMLDNLSTGLEPTLWLTREEMKNVNFIKDDVINYLQREMEILMFPEFDEVYHLASIVGGRSLIDGDPLMVAKDLAIDAIFFMWLTRKTTKVKKVLYASSSAAYPIFNQSNENTLKLSEDMIQFNENLSMPDMTYGWSKLTGEYLAKLAHEKYSIDIKCVRPFSGYGEDQDLTYPTPSIALRVARHDNPIEVWGTGEQARDFVYIEDCISAMTNVIEKGQSGGSYNIGSGVLTSFNVLIRVMCQIEGIEVNIRPLIDKPIGVQNRYSNVQKIQKELGWIPKYSLVDGLTLVLKEAHKRNERN